MRIKQSPAILAAIVVMGAFVAAPQSVLAASLQITDNTSDGQITITSGQFENGFSVNGTQIQAPSNTLLGSTTVAEANGLINFTGGWYSTGAALPAASTVLFVEASNPNSVSDVLTLNYSDLGNGYGQITGSFLSGSGLGVIGDYTGYTTYTESAGGYNFNAPYMSANAVSVSAVPVPAALWLFGSGLIGLVGVSRRATRAA